MRFAIEEAVRVGNKARLALAGPPGAGKTWTALVVATELAAGSDVLVIDTERRSASLYADAFRFKTIRWSPPFDPRELAQVIGEVGGGFGVVTVDSLSHFWAGDGRDVGHRRPRRGEGAGQPALRGGSRARRRRTRWSTPSSTRRATSSPRCDRSSTTCRSATTRAALVVRRVGMAPIQRDGIEYEFNRHRGPGRRPPPHCGEESLLTPRGEGLRSRRRRRDGAGLARVARRRGTADRHRAGRSLAAFRAVRRGSWPGSSGRAASLGPCARRATTTRCVRPSSTT